MEETSISKTTATVDADAAASVRTTGTVKSFDMYRKFGFITQEDGPEVFVHQEALMDGATITLGDRVSFEVTEGAKGLRAASVRKL